MDNRKLPKIIAISHKDNMKADANSTFHKMSLDTEDEVLRSISRAFNAPIKCALVIAVQGSVKNPADDVNAHIFGLTSIEDMKCFIKVGNEYIKMNVIAMARKGLELHEKGEL